jgi:hypothetical protein
MKPDPEGLSAGKLVAIDANASACTCNRQMRDLANEARRLHAVGDYLGVARVADMSLDLYRRLVVLK